VKKEFLLTKDGSHTIFIPELNETYHSKNGAIQESYHVYIKNGIHLLNVEEINILEIGFGTGLNALLTFIESKKQNLKINYHTVEAFPLDLETVRSVNYTDFIGEKEFYENIHQLSWNETHEINSNFKFTKHLMNFKEIDFEEKFDIIYFDAFGYDVQPDLWTLSQFQKMYKALKINGLLTTYACRIIIIQNMKEAGLEPIKKEGAPGKREMLNAFKI
jgi:tRNA U34 5-methylaminomethyl-2-thiouridine-forming methyltransferase MnmC